MKKFKKILSVALTSIIIISVFTISYNADDNNKTVYLGGNVFGVKFYSNGIMITNIEDYYDGSKYVCPARDGGLKQSDIIKKADDVIIKSNEDLKSVVENSKGKTINLKIERNSRVLYKQVKPVKNTVGVYLLGIWVRDSCAGIGTITYYDADNNYFAALGHGICDCDTLALLPLEKGEILNSNIGGVTKSVAGKVGSLNGYFTDKVIGKLTKNSSLGIYGKINDNFRYSNKKYTIADKNEIKIGKAQLFTTINNSICSSYDIEIKKICSKSTNTNENFVIKVTDCRIIEKCGGIVQGMSGSPIVQNGKIIGAVTHVFVNNPLEGYGIFLQNMVENYEN